MEAKNIKTEWCVLQDQYDSYEKHSLYIKLVSVTVLVATGIAGVMPVFTSLVLLVLWLQDAIWKTFQSRIETRLLQVESNISEKVDEHAFQFNTQYQSIRLKGLSLLGEYIHQSVRPTVAFPHAALILILLIQCTFF